MTDTGNLPFHKACINIGSHKAWMKIIISAEVILLIQFYVFMTISRVILWGTSLANGRLLFHGLEIGVHNIAVCFLVAFSILWVQLILSLSLLQALKHLSQALRLVSGFSSLVSYLALSSLFLVSSIREFLFSCFWACLCACVILCSPVYLEISVFASGL